MAKHQVILEIDAFTPGSLPMSRLADYLKPLAVMLGSEESVHFSKVEEGSTRIRADVEPHAAPVVRARAHSLIDGTAPKAAMKAFAAIDELLLEDNAIGGVFIGKNKLIEFAGRRRAAIEQLGPVMRTAAIDGRIFSIGGKDETINVHLRDGEDELRCVVSIELARRLAPHLFGDKLRLSGYGNWFQIGSQWHMKSFTATDFTVLENKPLGETLKQLQKIFEGISPDEFMAAMQELREE